MSLSWIKVLFEIPNILVNTICKFSISLFHAFVKFPFVYLSFIKKESIFCVLVILENADKNTFNMAYFLVNSELFSGLVEFFKMLIETNLLSLEGFWVALTKRQFFFRPIIHYKSFLLKFQVIFIIFNYQTWYNFTVD